MARFPFSMPGRKKQGTGLQPPPEALTSSKALKVLGSTLLSIDAAPSPHWDDGSSSALSDDTTATSLDAPDLDTDKDRVPVSIAKSDSEWGADSDVLPRPDVADFDDATQDQSTQDDMLRKSRSSSTITSWYDKSKLTLSISQQTSASAMAKGVPSNTKGNYTKAYLVLNGDVNMNSHFVKPKKKKPARLDLSSFVPGRRSSQAPRHSRIESFLGSDLLSRSSKLSPFNQVARDSIKQQLHNHSDCGPLLTPPTANIRSGSRNSQRTSSAQPSLFDHYEQMSMLSVMKQYPQENLSLQSEEREVEEGLTLKELGEPFTAQELDETLSMRENSRLDQDKHDAASLTSTGRDSKCLDWLHIALPPTPPTARLVDAPESSLDSSTPLIAYAGSTSSRKSAASKAAPLEKGLDSADLQQTSMLILTSDSEDEEADPPLTAKKAFLSPPTSTKRPRTFNGEDGAAASAALRPKRSSLAPTVSDKQSFKSARTSKRTSFATVQTYITIPNANQGTKPSHSSRDHRAKALSVLAGTDGLLQVPGVSSSRDSILSDRSGRSGHSIREARAVRLTQARAAPSRMDDDEQDDALGSKTPQRVSVATQSSTDQLTPPLSPTSVDFCIRSARTSVDGPGKHGRLMAVTQQEAMLLAALRSGEHLVRATALAELQKSTEREPSRPSRRGTSSQRQSVKTQRSVASSQGTVEPSASGTWLGLPDTPSFGKMSFSSSGSTNSLRSPGSHSKGNRGSIVEQTVEEVPLYFDDSEPSPDLEEDDAWHSATSPIWDVGHKERHAASNKTASACPKLLHPESRAKLSGIQQADFGSGFLGNDLPDTPISPDSFPSVPNGRLRRAKNAHLSAVGSSLRQDLA